MFILLFLVVYGFKYILVLRNGGEGARVLESAGERSRTVLGARESKKVFMSGGCGSGPHGAGAPASVCPSPSAPGPD